MNQHKYAMRALCLLGGLLAGLSVAIRGAAAIAPAPPHVIHTGLYAYRFALPRGWTDSPTQAARIGVRLALFPGGNSLAASSTVVYVNELCKQACGTDLAGVVTRTLAGARARNPQLRVATLPPLRTAAGRAVPVRLLSSDAATQRAREALAFIDTPQVVVLAVLTSKAPWRWHADYSAFGDMIAGFRYFDCSTPDAGAACR